MPLDFQRHILNTAYSDDSPGSQPFYKSIGGNAVARESIFQKGALNRRSCMGRNGKLGIILLLLTAATVTGLILNNNDYWAVYNYVSIVITAVCGFTLVRQK